MSGDLKRFLDDESGAEVVEWVVVAIILVLAAVAGMGAVSGKLKEMLAQITAEMEKARTPK